MFKHLVSYPLTAIAIIVASLLFTEPVSAQQNRQGSPSHWAAQKKSPLQNSHASRPTGQRKVAHKKAKLARLVYNQDTTPGAALYGLADRNGTIQRFVEEVNGIDLEPYVNKIVKVRNDSGRTLLATELDLPERTTPVIRKQVAVASAYAPRQASYNNQARRSRRRVGTQPRERKLSYDENYDTEPVQYEEEGVLGQTGLELPADQPVYSDQQIAYPTESAYGDELFNCGPNGCQPGARGVFYSRLEYSFWWLDGMATPPLVTTSTAGTPQSQAGVLGQTNTSILFGGTDIAEGMRDGLRVTAGLWLDRQSSTALEADFFFTGSYTENYSATGDGTTILARPFFNLTRTNAAGDVLVPAEDSELISFAGQISGTVAVTARTELYGTGIRIRKNICCKTLGGCNSCDGTAGCNTCGNSSSGFSNIDFLVGYRHLNLKDNLNITENLTSLNSAAPGNFDIRDTFNTENSFHGFDLGASIERKFGRMSLELLGKIALGNTRQRVSISGQTVTSLNGANSQTHDVGILALASNSGNYQRDSFSVVPELGATIGYQLSNRLKVTLGYTFLYWSNVVRPGDQIDLNVNSNGFAPVIAGGPARPEFKFHSTNLWAQSLNLGLDFSY